MKINFEDNKAIAIKLANKYAWLYERIGLTREDAMQEAYIGLIKSINKFDPSRGLKFSTLAYAFVKGELLNTVRDDKFIPSIREQRSSGKLKNMINLECKISSDVGKDILLKDILVSEEYIDIDKMNISAAIEKLEERERYIVVARFYEDFTISDIAKMFKISQPYASYLNKKALEKLKVLISC